MRKPINSSVPEELIQRIDEFVKSSKGSYKDRSHLVEQAVKYYLGDDLPLTEMLSKSSGGGQTPSGASSLYETSLFPRLAMNMREKKAIAAAAAGLVATGKSLFIDGSTTCIQLAKQLAFQRKGLTIVSNSSLICLELGHNGEHKIIGVGGEYDSSSASFVGCTCEEAMERFYMDFAFFSTKGFLPGEGTYESSMATLRVKQVVARRCARVVLLVDHTKFDQRSLCKVLDITQIHTVVTDDLTPQDAVDRLRQRGIEVLVAALQNGKDDLKAERTKNDA
jgi:DeoR/GlpR family transcriptional regulator of sugar metabolism